MWHKRQSTLIVRVASATKYPLTANSSPTRYICLTLSQDDTSAEFMRKVALKHMLFVTRLERALISYLVKEFECCLFTLKPDWSLADSF